MFGIGTSEILIILLIALLVLGPKEIPKVARTIGRTMRDLQRAKDELRQTIDSEFEESEVKTDQHNTKEEENKQGKNV
ncbi:Sec-independent protein translocase protein TatB [Desulfobacterota bacterium AH_259_B03_O07]|nr:Sec-independent protein translocase protein TatB [Desulfobacterota bacterium AH_259_B03_O07]